MKRFPATCFGVDGFVGVRPFLCVWRKASKVFVFGKNAVRAAVFVFGKNAVRAASTDLWRFGSLFCLPLSTVIATDVRSRNLRGSAFPNSIGSTKNSLKGQGRAANVGIRKREHMVIWLDGLRKAGQPE
jgi:hypothetical protein